MPKQYEIVFEGQKGDSVTSIGYGVVEKFLVCLLGAESHWGKLRNSTQVLAVITPFKTDGQDASIDLTHYNSTAATIITDVRNIKRLAGRVLTRGRWGLIDQTMSSAQGTFAATADYEDSSSDD
jgi:hypothetical protein